MQRYKVRIAYNGKHFSGWQIQKHTHIKTVQGTIEDALSRILDEKIRIQGSSRTDAGVHAQGQIAHMTTKNPVSIYNTLMRANALLSPDIVLCEMVPVSLNFHAQKYTKRKHYIYSLWTHRQYVLPRYHGFVWQVDAVDINLMKISAQYFVGKHDFAVFQNTGSSLFSTIRTLFSIDITQGSERELLEIHICGDGFLKQMVRNIVGLLVYIGRKKIPMSFLDNTFFSYERKNLPSPTAPAQGLSLHSIEYDESIPW
ncbi:MAG: tRNA pseudouridine(38-40) synthase TruA [Desulfovibrionaceae bacterium]